MLLTPAPNLEAARRFAERTGGIAIGAPADGPALLRGEAGDSSPAPRLRR